MAAIQLRKGSRVMLTALLILLPIQAAGCSFYNSLSSPEAQNTFYIEMLLLAAALAGFKGGA